MASKILVLPTSNGNIYVTDDSIKYIVDNSAFRAVIFIDGTKIRTTKALSVIEIDSGAMFQITLANGSNALAGSDYLDSVTASPAGGSFFVFKDSSKLELLESVAELTGIINEEAGGTEMVLIADETTNQTPTALDTPLGIKFGAEQGDSESAVMISDTGVVTFNVAGTYDVRMRFAMSRGSNAGTSVFFVRGLLDGVQFGKPVATEATDKDNTATLEYTTTISVASGTEFSFQCVRDSQGADDGELQALISSTAWGISSSASLRILLLG